LEVEPVWTETLFLAGRILLGGYYIMGGIQHLTRMKPTVWYARSKGVPAPDLAVPGTGAMLILGGLSLLLGLYPVVGVALIVLFLVPTTFTMHAFWAEPVDKRQGQMINFMKNVALIGAALMLLAIPTPWPLSLF
jgi:putative oxidoreductase